MTIESYKPPEVVPPVVAGRLPGAASTLRRVNAQATGAPDRPGPRTHVRALLTSAAEHVLLYIDQGRTESAESMLLDLERIARDAIAHRRAQVAEPGAGGHRWFTPADGGAEQCTACTVRAFPTVIEPGLVPVCGTAPPCRLGYHLIARNLHAPGRAMCLYCDLVVTVPAGSGS